MHDREDATTFDIQTILGTFFFYVAKQSKGHGKNCKAGRVKSDKTSMRSFMLSLR